MLSWFIEQTAYGYWYFRNWVVNLFCVLIVLAVIFGILALGVFMKKHYCSNAAEKLGAEIVNDGLPCVLKKDGQYITWR